MGRVQYASILLFVLALGSVKLSFIFFYRRLFVTARRTAFDWAVNIAIGVIVLWSVSLFFGFLFACGTHVSAAWGSVKDEEDFCGAALDLDNAYVL
ncbi:MAG: hypothetical protein Q9218_005611 [Villophora microphyllina]